MLIGFLTLKGIFLLVIGFCYLFGFRFYDAQSKSAVYCFSRKVYSELETTDVYLFFFPFSSFKDMPHIMHAI